MLWCDAECIELQEKLTRDVLQGVRKMGKPRKVEESSFVSSRTNDVSCSCDSPCNPVSLKRNGGPSGALGQRPVPEKVTFGGIIHKS